MIAVAKERMAAQGLKNVTFQPNEHDDLPALQDNSFDAATCRLGLMFMPDPVRMLKAVRRTLKP
jgi:ubiquinone/menaquinone biosynthesis C-methylase UbiE